jgi:hypothetical protein
VGGSVSIRFDSVLGDVQRAEFTAGLSSHAARLASWKPHAPSGRTYALVEYAADSPAQSIQAGHQRARVDDPALVVIDIAPADPRACVRLARALGGPGRPVGVVDACACERSVVVELDDRRTALALVVDLIDCELADVSPGRAIAPLLPLSDETLAAFAAAVLSTPEIDRSRIVETYTEPLLAGRSG